jgi:hypothetical protein
MRQKRKSGILFILSLFAISVSSLYLFSGHTAAATGINPELSFEGKIVTAAGINIPDGTYNIEFTIYTGCTNNTGSGCTTAWTEDYLDTGTNTGGVTFNSGTFQVNLGSICSFSGGSCETYTNSAINWNTNPLYLSLQIGNNAACTVSSNFHSNCSGDGVMSPYILLTSTPYSFNSSELNGISSSGYIQTASPTTQTIQPTTNVVGLQVDQTSASSPTADIFDVQGSGGSGNIVQATAAGALNLSTIGTTQTLSLSTAASTTASTGAITIQSGNASSGSNLSAGTITIDTGTQTGVGTATINLGTTNATALNIGNTTSASTTTILAGVNGTTPTISLQASGSGYIAIGTTSTNAIEIGATGSSGISAHTVIINGNSCGSLCNVDTTTIGAFNAVASTTTIQGGSGTAAIALTPYTTGTIVIGYSAGSGSITLGSSSAAETTIIGGGGGLSTVQIAGGTAANVVQIANAQTGGSVSIGAGMTSGTTAINGGTTTVDSAAALNVGSSTATSLNFGSTAHNTSTVFNQTASTTAFVVQNASGNILTVDTSGNQVVLGDNTAAINGQLAFQNGSNSNTVTIASGVTSTGYSITLPTAAGSASTCLQYGGSGTQLQWGACGSGATGLAKNTADSSSAAVSASSYLYQFGNSSSNASGVLLLNNNANTNSALNVTASGNPGTNQAIIYGSDTNASPSGNLLLLQAGSGPTSILTVTAGGTILVGSNSTSNTNQAYLQLNSFNTFADTGTCSTSTNQGALYYNTNSNNVRACINGAWQDLVSTAGLSQLLFGVVPNSGNNPGDLIGASATSSAASNTGGPCKVNFDSNTTGSATVYVNSCLAYSGGREVSVPATIVSLSGVAASSYQLICLNSSGTPALFGSSGTTAGTQSENTLTITNGTTYGQPTLCLADIETNAANAGTLLKIFDVRTFTTTTKTYATMTTAADAVIGTTVGPALAASAGTVIWPTSTTGQLQGVIVASNGAAGTNGTPNIMIATAGPQWTLAQSGTVDDYIIPSAGTAFDTGVTTTAPTAYNTLGIDLATYATSCTAQTFGATDCQYSDFTYITIQ